MYINYISVYNMDSKFVEWLNARKHPTYQLVVFYFICIIYSCMCKLVVSSNLIIYFRFNVFWCYLYIIIKFVVKLY